MLQITTNKRAEESFALSGFDFISNKDCLFFSFYNGLGSSLYFYVAGMWVGDIEAEWPTW